MTSRALLFALAAAAVAPIATAHAQYFGRNKVQYETFDFRVQRSEHFDLHYYPSFTEPAADALRMLERWHGRLSDLFGYSGQRTPLILYADHPDFQQTNVIGGELSQGTGGVTESLRNRVVLPLTGLYSENDHVLGHELVHVFQYELAQRQGGNSFQNFTRLPLWVVEGFAEYLTAGREDAHTAMWMRDAVIRSDLPTVRELSRNPEYFPYRYGQALWAFIGGKYGDRRAMSLYKLASSSGSFEVAAQEVLGVAADSLSAEWHRSLRDAYEPLLARRTPPAESGEPLVMQRKGRGLNVSPVVSPDGRYVAFFSQRNLFTVDLFLADASTGEILQTLASPIRGGHFDDLSFISSAGTWSPDSREFAFIVFARGDNQINILNVESRKPVTTIRPQGVGAITGISWSPDGNRIAFAGLAGGVSDLYTVSVSGTGLVRHTNDKWGVIHPAWSPDGSEIAFATDRGPGANMETLAHAPLRIATYSMATGDINILPGFPEAKHINPQYSPDGQSIYFIADVSGFSDIFRLHRGTGTLHRVTNLQTGVSGITALSPALSVASGTGTLVFSIFTRSGTNLHRIVAADGAGTPVQATESAPGGTLPPSQSGVVEGYLNDNTTFLTRETAFPQSPYSARLGLDYIGEPTIGFTASNYGSGLFGSVAFYFGDMLGDKTLGTSLTAQGDVRDYGAEVFFLDRKRRINWGAVGARVPYLSGFTQISDTVVSGIPALSIEQVIRRTNNLQGALLVQYPLSPTRRLEFDLGYNSISYDTEVWRWIDFGGFVEGPYRSAELSPPGLGYGELGAALVGDNSYFGFTSPILGGRYRLQLSPVFGSVNFTSLLADGRRYFMARPVTFAFRALHFGRYGSDSESDRITPLYVGNDQFVRGYNIYTFTSADCTVAGGGASSCPEFDRLIGSRLAVANAEIRVPLFGSRSYGLIATSFLPIEIAAFADAGAAWTSAEGVAVRFDRTTTERVPVLSAGLTTRINLFGYAVVEIFHARPFQRASRSGVWGFQFAPGW